MTPLTRRRLLAALALPAVAGCAGPKKGSDRIQEAGTLTGTLVPSPDPPRVGLDTDFGVILTDRGTPVIGAQVAIALFFRSMNQAGPTAVCTAVAPGRYLASALTTGMNGRWEAVVTISRPSQPDAQLTFPFLVAK